MSGYGGYSQSGSKNQSSSSGQFNQKVWNGQAPFLKDMYGQASGLFGQTNQGMMNAIPGAGAQNNLVQDSSNNAWNQQLQGGAYQSIDANKLQDQIYSSMQGPTATQEINNMIMGGKGNNYADAMKNQYVQDANVATQNMLNNLDARASAAGMSGSSRQGIASGIGFQDINRNLQQNLATTGYNTFDKDLDRKLQIAGQADQANLARQGMLGDMLAGKNSSMQTGVAGAGNQAGLGMNNVNMYNAPWQAFGDYANALGRPTILGSGSNMGQSTGSSNSMGVSGGGGASVICSEFYAQGYMDPVTYAADELYGFNVRQTDPAVYQGYIQWAPSVVKLMKKSPLVTNILWIPGKAWAQQMRHITVGDVPSNWAGRLIMSLGTTLCRTLGKEVADGYRIA